MMVQGCQQSYQVLINTFLCIHLFIYYFMHSLYMYFMLLINNNYYLFQTKKISDGYLKLTASAINNFKANYGLK